MTDEARNALRTIVDEGVTRALVSFDALSKPAPIQHARDNEQFVREDQLRATERALLVVESAQRALHMDLLMQKEERDARSRALI